MFYPRRKAPGDICSDYDPRIMCAPRRFAVVNGSFGYDQKRKGYYCTQITGPFEIPVLLDACPFCHELLPGYNARKRFFDKLEAEERSRPKLLPPPDDTDNSDLRNLGEMDCIDGDTD